MNIQLNEHTRNTWTNKQTGNHTDMPVPKQTYNDWADKQMNKESNKQTSCWTNKQQTHYLPTSLGYLVYLEGRALLADQPAAARPWVFGVIGGPRTTCRPARRGTPLGIWCNWRAAHYLPTNRQTASGIECVLQAVCLFSLCLFVY